MPSTYKTPGVYIEEIVKFPPSVAEVETAIPAFIGYSEFAEANGESLLNIPTRITSFLEFEQYFGGPPPRDIIILLNSANQYVRTVRETATYLLYDSIRLFYDNGGGACYIVSVGDYTKTPDIGDINTVKGILGGLKALEKYDEPTLLLSPDAATLDSDLYTFQVQALNQCNTLQDRFLIGDLLKNDEKTAGETHNDRVADFRNNIGINYLKYGAAYTPWLRTSLQADLSFRDILFALDSPTPSPTTDTSLALLISLTNTPSLVQLMYDLSNAIKAVDALNAAIKPGGALVDADMADLDGELKKLQRAYQAVYNDVTKTTYPDFSATLTALFQKIVEILAAIKTVNDTLPDVVASLPAPTPIQTVEFKLKNDIIKIQDQVKSIMGQLVAHNTEILDKSAAALTLLPASANLTKAIALTGYADLAHVPADAATQGLYRVFKIKEVILGKLHDIAAAAGPNASDALAAVIAAIPATTDLKTKVDAQISASIANAANVTTGDVVTDLNTKAGAAAANDRVVFFTASTYTEQDNTINKPADKAHLVPNPPGFPVGVANALNQILLTARQAAAQAAAQAGANPASVATALLFTPVDPREYTLIASSAAGGAGAAAIGYFNTILNSASSYESVFDQSLLQGFGLYKTLVTKAGQELMILPPGAAVAGVYASVDANRGVWKAPANTSLASVLGPYILLNAMDQESLNVDDNAGKSINAIRAFTGKGTLVWGTRTLAGNDNEWRYVPVRRFFNYAEESIKNATETFVFEPNDINTWIRGKAMIENFLTLEWRRGALAGAKATDAFYVKVGLGETMTSQDILEGRMIFEIGMAVVRPAEFIVLRFFHKMQES